MDIRVAPRQPPVEQGLSRQQTSFMSRLCCGSAQSAEPAPKVSRELQRHELLSLSAMGVSSSSVELGPIPPASTRQLRPVQEVVLDGGTGSSASEGTIELAERQAARRTSAFLDNSHHSSPSPHLRECDDAKDPSEATEDVLDGQNHDNSTSPVQTPMGPTVVRSTEVGGNSFKFLRVDTVLGPDSIRRQPPSAAMDRAHTLPKEIYANPPVARNLSYRRVNTTGSMGPITEEQISLVGISRQATEQLAHRDPDAAPRLVVHQPHSDDEREQAAVDTRTDTRTASGAEEPAENRNTGAMR